MSFKQFTLVVLSFIVLALPITAQETTPEPPPPPTLEDIITTLDESGNMLAVAYPESWIAIESNGQIHLGSSSPTLADFILQRPYDESGTAGIIGAFPRGFLLALDLPLDIAPVELVVSLQNTLFAESEDITFADPVPITLNEIEGAILRGTRTLEDSNQSVLFMVLSYVDSFIFVNFSAPEGELSIYEETIFTIARTTVYSGTDVSDSSLTISVNALPQTFESASSELGSISFTYPEGWAIDDNTGVYLANSETALESAVTGVPISVPETITGQIIITDIGGLIDFGISPRSSALDVLQVFRTQQLGGLPVDDPQIYNINGLDVASIRATAENPFGEIELWFFMVKVNDGFILLAFTTLEDEMRQFEQTIFALVGSMTYSDVTDE